MKIIKFNPEYFNTSGIANFSVDGLFSIILDKHGPFKRRLFIYANDSKMDHVPFHAHKYIDEMEYLFGHVEDVCISETYITGPTELKEYSYTRLNQEYKPLSATGLKKSFKLDCKYLNSTHKIYAHQLHTVNIIGVSAWIINELALNPLYERYEGKCYSAEDINNASVNTKQMTEDDYKYISYVLSSMGYKLVESEPTNPFVNMYALSNAQTRTYIKSE